MARKRKGRRGRPERQDVGPADLALHVIPQTKIVSDRRKRVGIRVMRYRDTFPDFDTVGSMVKVTVNGWEIVDYGNPEVAEMADRMLQRMLMDSTPKAREPDGGLDPPDGHGRYRLVSGDTWSKYANMAVVLRDGTLMYNAHTNDLGFYRKVQSMAPDELCRMARIHHPPVPVTDVTHPCGLATCTRVIRDAEE